MTPDQLGVPRPLPTNLLLDRGWWIFCFIIFCLKFALLAIDPNPKLFMGDSGSYLWTALSGWIPPDRSILYGFVIRWVSLTTHSLSYLLILQTFLGAGTAILLAVICRLFFFLSNRSSYIAGCVCAIDPMQLVWERYVMTETISLFLYAIMLAVSLSYLRQRRLWQLALVQLFAVFAISFRISYLLVVQATTVILPLIAFLPFLRTGQFAVSRAIGWKSVAIHLAFSISIMLALHVSYKQINGRLAGQPPAYLYSSGFSILATWAPALQPNDSADPRLSEILAKGEEFHLTNIRLRNSQLYSKGYLVDRWKRTETNLFVADQVAKQTALRALIHRPLSILSLGCRTFFGYFHPHLIHQQAKSDLGKGDWPKPMSRTMAERFRLAPPSHSDAKTQTLLQRYFLHAQLYYYVVVLSPFICGALLFLLRETYILLLLLHGGVFLGTDSFLAVTSSVRYLQPLSFLTILIFALLGNYIIARFRTAPHSAAV